MTGKWLDRCVSLNIDTEMLYIDLDEISNMFKQIGQYVTLDYEAITDFRFKDHKIRVGISRTEENKIRIKAQVVTDNEYSWVLSSHLMEYSPVLAAEHNIRPLIDNAEYNIERLKETKDCYLLE